MESFLLTISGRVQGIGFRYSCQSLANSLQLKGYAKNLIDGKVEILVQGKKEHIEEFQSRLNSLPLARISQIKKEKTDSEKKDDFQIL